jgi:glutamyl-Q tRNA(Asp) synthetase
VASYLQASVAGGKWLLRIENIDPPREQSGADSLIMAALDRYGFEWHGPVLYQDSARDRHLQLVDQLVAARLAYPCSCSRKDLATAPRGQLGIVYPGYCRTGCNPGEAAVRMIADDTVRFTDGLQGPQVQDLSAYSGDYVIHRRDGLIAYQLAVVADDFDQGITEVVRGIDLLDSTPRQIHLQNRLGFTSPAYRHIPVALNDQGQKLSKLTGARPIPTSGIRGVLTAALAALGQSPPADLAESSLPDMWSWAVSHWRMDALRGVQRASFAQGPLAEPENGLS